MFPRGGLLGAFWTETCWHVVGGPVQAVAGCGCRTARHSASLKQANTREQGQNLQGRRAAGWAQLDAVEDAQNSSHQPEQDESEPDAEQDSVQGVRRLMKEEHRAVVAGRHRRGCEALDQTDKWRV